MSFLQTLLSIILFIFSLGVLVTIHEAGHLSMAKVFKVYCHEFSVGFGPKLLKVRKQGHETYFSIRAIPFGGYVSMFGEGAEELPEFKDVPQERSLEGVKKWKKAIIVSAGVILNAILALILILISNLAFPLIRQTASTIIEENSTAYVAGVRSDDRIKYIYPSSMEQDRSIRPFVYEYTTEDKIIHAGNFFIVDNDISMPSELGDDKIFHYVLTFMYTGDKKNSVLTDGIKLYPAISKEDVIKNKYVNTVFGDWALEDSSPNYYPDFTKAYYVPGEHTSIKTHINFMLQDESQVVREMNLTTVGENGKYKWKDIGISFRTDEYWAPLSDRFKQSFVDYGNAAGAVFKGLGVLFTGGIRNMSGIVGIFETSASLLTNYTFATYLYFWGLISVNLAIFNLLPFPGLDGWQLLVTAIEGISHKKIPNRFKQIMSMIGLVLLFVLMIGVVVMDVLRMTGV